MLTEVFSENLQYPLGLFLGKFSLMAKDFLGVISIQYTEGCVRFFFVFQRHLSMLIGNSVWKFLNTELGFFG